ncbi:MAG: efflux RND transporter periplasmic adaptor subunit [Verrucomicrobiales bacterium]|nr:efflux RND transporter periplasmic adaptor subunit [Verrucomicrobiales bacterium]
MRTISYLLLIPLLLSGGTAATAEDAIDPARAANTVILDDTAKRNLQIQTIEVTEETFETTVFAIGRIEEIPASRSALSSRIAGRVVELNAHVGDFVNAGDVLARVESRQPGNPPPTIDLKALQGGLVVDSHVRIGEPVEPASDLLDVADRSRLWATAKIPEPEAQGIVPGTVAKIRIPALGDEVIEATLARFGVEADREAGAIEGIFELENRGGLLQPGMRAEFSIITKRREDIMAVPRTAIQGDPTKRVVFIKDYELPNAFVRAPVVLGEQNDAFVEVIAGLFPGDEVVTRGSYALSFAGSGSGMSLKEALDAAHGHEHNEDGSEITDVQKAAKTGVNSNPETGNGESPWFWVIIAWAAVTTLATIILAQRSLKNKPV